MPDTVLTVQRDDDQRRLDRIIRKLLPDYGLSRIYRLIRTGRIRLNDRKSRPSDRAAEGDRIVLRNVPVGAAPRSTARAGGAPETEAADRTAPRFDIRRMTLWESDDLLALNKPRGALVHGPGSLDEAVKEYLADRLAPSLSFRPGPLHRLDRNTTGVLFFSKSLAGARIFSDLLKSRRLVKLYIGILDGRIARPQQWRDVLARNSRARTTAAADPSENADGRRAGASRGGGRGSSAVSAAEPIASEGGISLVLLRIESGRTHQIRAQAAHHGHPLTGDSKYGGGELLASYLLHAAAVGVTRGASTVGFSSVAAPLPTSAVSAVSTLFGEEALAAARRAIRRALSA
jgi:23S rRNA pseudouridine955/2504/2580 synthase